jgi:hypothetical protein
MGFLFLTNFSTNKEKFIMTTLTLSPNQVKERLRVSLKANVPCFIMGSPSTAKSHTVRTICEEEGLYMIDVRLSQMLPMDLN